MKRLSQINEKIEQSISQIISKTSEQVWFQTLKSRFEELDPKLQKNIQLIVTVAVPGIFILFFLSWGIQVSSIQSQYHERKNLLKEINQASLEMNSLRSSTSNAATSASTGSEKWSEFFKSSAQKSSIQDSQLKVTTIGQGKTSEETEESLYELEAEKVNIKQITQFAFLLENSAEPVKVRNLFVQTLDNQGYLSGKLWISVFDIKKNK